MVQVLNCEPDNDIIKQYQPVLAALVGQHEGSDDDEKHAGKHAYLHPPP